MRRMVVRKRAPSRRTFVKIAATALAGTLAPVPGFTAGRPLFRALGITAKLDRAQALEAAGADFIVESVADFLRPFASDSEFAAQRERARRAPLRVRGCNSFMRDPSLICVGPAADHPRVLSYAATAFERLRSIGGEYIVFGSNTARRIPEGWSKARADEQFVALLKAMAPLAKRHRITVGVEMQQRSECNYLNFIEEVVQVVEPVAHPNIRVLADLFHMRVMGDSPRELAAAMPWVGLVELAEKQNRTLPGIAGDDFRPYLTELARAGYSGLADVEGDGSAEELRKAFATVRDQARDAKEALRAG
jgi:sugar phosphate isomerase/epimerase